MGYTNSPLVNYIKLSPNCNKPRKNKITKIVIHHMAGNLTVETCGNGFSNPSRQASSNYGIGTDGRVGLYVEECNRAWTSGNSVDHQAVTIEIANDTIGGNWHVSDKALEKTIELCVDICKRNGIEALNFTGDKNGNLVAHRYYQATTCPGEYLYSKFPYIANEVNERLAKTNDVFSISDNSYLYDCIDYALVFNPTYYAEKYSDLKAAFGTDIKKLFNHFIQCGMKEGRQASENFNVTIYKNKYEDLKKAFGDDLTKYYQHYIQFGYAEKRKAV